MSDVCPGCGEAAVVFTTGSDIHWYEIYECPHGHEWVVPYTQDRIDYWMKMRPVLT